MISDVEEAQAGAASVICVVITSFAVVIALVCLVAVIIKGIVSLI